MVAIVDTEGDTVFGHRLGRTALTLLTATGVASVALSISAPVASAEDPAAGTTTVAIPPPGLATFSGIYDPLEGHSSTAKTCTSRTGDTCVLYFKTPQPAVVCADTGDWATTAWFSPKDGTRAPAVPIDMYWAGGGAMTGTAPAVDAPGMYAARIQVEHVCGTDATTTVGLPDADAVLGAAGRTTFSGYVNSVRA